MTAAAAASPDRPNLDRLVEDALRAFAAAPDIPTLNRARLEHLGDRSPVALALREVAGAQPWERPAWRQSAELARHRIAEAAVRYHAELEHGRPAPAASSPAPGPCTRRPIANEPVYGCCPTCGHILMLHANNGTPCAVCALHEAARAIRGGR